MKKIMGVDEAGRGPVLGDLFIAGVTIYDETLPLLNNSEVTDSKQLSKKKREELYEFVTSISAFYSIERISTLKIDERINCESTLNDLETKSISKLIIEHQPDIVYIDAIGRDLDKYKKNLTDEIRKKISSIPEIIAEFKADIKYKIVGAASILAKVDRDRSIAECNQLYPDLEIGSGYPSDEKTIEFLRNFILKHKKPPSIARVSWKTCIDLMNELVYQKKLDSFF
jgi:ribonuclease HII